MRKNILPEKKKIMNGRYSIKERTATAMKKKIAAIGLAVCLFAAAIGLGGCRGLIGGDSWIYGIGPGETETDTETENGTEQNHNAGMEETAVPQKDITTIKQESSSGKEALTVSEIYSENVTSVVGIRTEGTTTNIFGQVSTTASTGTGIILTDNGYIVTNCHVVEGGSTYQVALFDGTVYDARLVGAEPANDVAVLKIEASGLNAAELGDSDEIVVGEDVIVIGNPLGELTYTLTRGVVSALNRAINTDGTPINMFQVDAAVNAGNSGGPAFDATGHVIGMVTAKYASDSVEGIGFCIPVSDVVKIANELIQYGYVRGKAALEIGVEDAYSRSFWGTSRISGAYVSYVVEGGCSDAAGIRVGSLINYVNSTAVTSAADLSVILRSFSKGETVTVRGYYNNRAFEASVTLGEYSPELIPSGWSSEDGTIV